MALAVQQEGADQAAILGHEGDLGHHQPDIELLVLVDQGRIAGEIFGDLAALMVMPRASA
jgi:hypothetical protein